MQGIEEDRAVRKLISCYAELMVDSENGETTQDPRS